MPGSTVRVRDTELHVRIAGDGPPFVWGHGLLGSIAQEDDTSLFGFPGASSLATLVRYDARGHGRSPAAGPPSAYRWSSLAEDMLAVARATSDGPYVLGGASMGCATALHAAVAAPELVRALVLAIPPTAWKTRPAQARAYGVGARVVDIGGALPLRLLARLAPRPPALSGPLGEVHRATLDHLRRIDRRGAAAALRGASRSDLPPPAELAAIDVPALVLAWTGDRSHPLSTAEELDRLLPGAELHIASTADDVARWPDLVLDLLKR